MNNKTIQLITVLGNIVRLDPSEYEWAVEKDCRKGELVVTIITRLS